MGKSPDLTVKTLARYGSHEDFRDKPQDWLARGKT
jgi:hypothetical protein